MDQQFVLLVKAFNNNAVNVKCHLKDNLVVCRKSQLPFH